jgi:hypothetical protein
MWMFLFQDVTHTCFVNPRLPDDYEGFRVVSFSSHAPDCSIAAQARTWFGGVGTGTAV